MGVKEYTGKIIKELQQNLDYVDDEELKSLIELILRTKNHHIFLAGAGRSGVAIHGFANRLMHLGFSVSVVGEISSPHSREGDLLIIGSGSGETESLKALAAKASKNKIKIILFTMDINSMIAKLADTVVVIPGVSPKLQNEGMNFTSIQPMGSAFEQLCFLIYDSIIMELMDHLRETSDTMFQRHADFE